MTLLRWEEQFEDTKGVIGIRISKKNREHNGQNEKYKRTNNYLQNSTHKTKDRVTRIQVLTWYRHKIVVRLLDFQLNFRYK